MKQVMNPPTSTFKPDPRMRNKKTKATAMENSNLIKKMSTKKSKILTEDDNNTNNTPSMLDEDNIL